MKRRGISPALGNVLLLSVALAMGALGFLDAAMCGRRPSVMESGLAIGRATLALAAMIAFRRVYTALRRQARTAARRGKVLEAIGSREDRGQIDGALNGLAEQACRALEIDGAAVLVRDRHDPAMMETLAVYGEPKEMVGTRWPSSDGICGLVLESGEPITVDDYSRVPRPIAAVAAAGARAGAAVPIRWGGETRGALLAISFDHERRFGEPELRTLTEVAAPAALILEQAEMRERLKEALSVGTTALAAALSARDGYTAEHSGSVVGLACCVGARLRLDEQSMWRLGVAARLHDVGKLSVPDAILRKPGPLHEKEWEVMRQHPVYGAEVVSGVPGLEDVAEVVVAEHESWDGTGYPVGLRGEEIPIEARIILACDALHAMTSDRPYRRPLARHAAIRELRAGAGSQFDSTVVDALIAVLAARDAGSGTEAAGRAESRPATTELVGA